eukprot:12932624-Prorocentrum_lima.AAC.1
MSFCPPCMLRTRDFTGRFGFCPVVCCVAAGVLVCHGASDLSSLDKPDVSPTSHYRVVAGWRKILQHITR